LRSINNGDIKMIHSPPYNNPTPKDYKFGLNGLSGHSRWTDNPETKLLYQRIIL